MKVLNLVKSDILFQFKYGFYYLYGIFSIFYIIIIRLLPDAWQVNIAYLLIFSDPAAVGLVFIGAVIYLELDEKTAQPLFVSPVKPFEYLLSKMISLSIISAAAGLFIGAFTGVIENPCFFTAGLILGSMFFTEAGFIAAFRSRSLNHFFLLIITAIAAVMLQGVFYIFISTPAFLVIHPGAAVLEMLSGGDYSGAAAAVMAAWLVFGFKAALLTAGKHFNSRCG